MSFVDHEGGFQVDFSRNEMFPVVLESLRSSGRFTIENANDITGIIKLKAGMSLFSWGESITISLIDIGESKAKISICSTPVTGALFGGAMDMGKNRQNIDEITNVVSQAVSVYASNKKSTTKPIPSDINSNFIFTCPFCNTQCDCSPELEHVLCTCPICGGQITPER